MAFVMGVKQSVEVALTGLLPGGRKWAMVQHFQVATLTVTSTHLLAKAIADWQAIATAYLNSGVTLVKTTLRAIDGWKARRGRMARIGITLGGGGTITAITIIDGGSGYTTPPNLTIYTSTGTGLQHSLTVVGGAIATITLVNGGTGYGFADYLQADLPNDPSFVGQRVLPLFTSQDISLTTGAGGIATDALPNFAAYSVQLRNALPGRNGRGAQHWPGVPEANTLLNNINAGVITGFNTLLVNYTNTYAGGGGTYFYCGLSRQVLAQTNINNNVPYTAFAQWSTATLNPLLGTMRRRKVKAP